MANSATCMDIMVDSKASRGDGSVATLIQAALLNIAQLVAAVTVLVCLGKSRRAHSALAPRGSKHRRGDPVDWFRKAYAVDVEEAITIDGQVVVRLCLVGVKFSAVGTAVACVLMPIYGSAGTLQQGMQQFSISNLTPSAARGDPAAVWWVIAAAYLYTAVFIWLMRAEWRQFMTIRQKHFIRKARGELGTSASQAQCSLMVERIPLEKQSAAALQEFFSKLFDDRIHSCVMQRDTLMLYHLKALKMNFDSVSCFFRCCKASVDKNLERIVKLERDLAKRARDTEAALQGVALDGRVRLDDFSTAFAGVGTAITGVGTALLRAPASPASPEAGASASKECTPQQGTTVEDPLARPGGPGAHLPATSTAFVTLRRVSERVVSEQVLLFPMHALGDSSEDWIVKPAPEARDVIWENAGIPLAQGQYRIKLGQAFCFLGVLVWSVPIGGIQALASEATLNQHCPRTVQLMRAHAPQCYTLLTGYLPVLALMLLVTLLPYALRFLALNFEVRKTKTEISRSVLFRNFMFQFFSLWLTVFSSSLMDSFRSILNHPACVSTILGASIPKVSAYFLAFVIARIGISLPLLLLRLPALLASLAGQKPEPVHCLFETELTNIAIVFVIGSMYCLVAPVIMPACLIYFGLAFGVYKWLFVHVYESEFDCAGELWYEIFNGLVGGMLFGMLSVCGLASIYAGPRSYQFYAMSMLPMLIIAFAVDCNSRFGLMSRVMPYQDAVDLDREGGINHGAFAPDYYVDPILHVGGMEKPPGTEPSHESSGEEESGDDASPSE